MSKILDQVKLPKDLKKLSLEEKTKLCEEIRKLIIDVTSKKRGTCCIKPRNSRIDDSLTCSF